MGLAETDDFSKLFNVQHENNVISYKFQLRIDDTHVTHSKYIDIVQLIFNMYHNSVVSQRVDNTRLLTVMSRDSSVDIQHVSQQCRITTS